jgi:hypothetical protein
MSQFTDQVHACESSFIKGWPLLREELLQMYMIYMYYIKKASYILGNTTFFIPYLFWAILLLVKKIKCILRSMEICL